MFAVIPHYNNPNHRDACGDNAAIWASKLQTPAFAIDDQTTVKIADRTIEVISEEVRYRWRSSATIIKE